MICPRCGSRLIRTHDEGVCLVHGTIITPVRAWDPPAEVDLAARRGNRFSSPEWTDEERGWWREAGDPLPPEPAKVGRPPQAVCMRGHVKNTATMDGGGRCAICRQMMEKARRERNKAR